MDNSSRLELLKLCQDEWIYRHDSFWKRITQFFVIIFFTSTLPITIRVFDATIPDMPLFIFPAAGIVLSLLFLWYSLAESYRLNATNARINAILMQFPAAYRKTAGLKGFFKKDKTAPKMFYWPIAFWVPVVLFTLELTIAILMLILIFTGHLSTC